MRVEMKISLKNESVSELVFFLLKGISGYVLLTEQKVMSPTPHLSKVNN